MSKYQIFSEVAATGSFTQAALKLNYSQSAVSQAIKNLEKELGTTLFTRNHDGLVLTSDGMAYSAYIQDIYYAEIRLIQKQHEMQHLEDAVIRLGTITSITRGYLPQKMHSFRKLYPTVRFVLRQNDYNGIMRWVNENEVDLGFVDTDVIHVPDGQVVYHDEMLAVLPCEHTLAKKQSVSIEELLKENFILADQGEDNNIFHAFPDVIQSEKITYTVYDDYSIIEMVRLGMGVSVLSASVVSGFEGKIAAVPLKDTIKREIALTWKNWNTLPYASKMFAEYLLGETE